MKLEAHYEVKPYRVNQVWNVYRPDIYQQFGFTNHNGVDFAHGDDSLLRAPFPVEVTNHGYQPNGGGIYITCISQHEYDFADGRRCHVFLDYLHLAEIRAAVGSKIDTGELLAVQGSTGFSTGPHTHRQPRRVIKSPSGIIEIDVNDANNTFNFDSYFTGKYAVDVKLGELREQLRQLLAILVDLLTKKLWNR